MSSIFDKRSIVEDMISNNLTILMASEKYNCSVESLEDYIFSLKKSDDAFDVNLYNNYCDVSKKIVIRNIVKDIILNNLTILMASEKYKRSVKSLKDDIYLLKKSDDESDINLYNNYCDASKKIVIRNIVEDMILNGLTALKASEKYDCSVSSIRKYIASLKKSDDEYDKDLYNRYLIMAKRNEKEGKLFGAKTGKRTSDLKGDSIRKIYKLLVDNHYTLRYVEEITGVSRSTMYENFMKHLDESEKMVLQQVFDENKKNGKNDYKNDSDNSYNFHYEGSQIALSNMRRKK